MSPDIPLSLASQLPQGPRCLNAAQKNVGASLLAKAVDQPTWLSTDTPFSRAGSLPQGYCLRLDYPVIAPECPCAVSLDLAAVSSWPSRRAA
ncbi:hypothetical protein DBR24_13670 [Pseudomonas sp. HMWF006]|nr:hypothetical protein DBR24_13670 [Pseudomonas sp. HMWF006]PTT71978.1 hypothetical protein DBR26_06200 [Pseudomonas sp. HMWF007]PTT88766.1 hypothetical protein DBR29_17095 [Pseudomonas sp. HMWF005]